MKTDIARIKIALEDDEYGALAKMANAELRGLSDQVRHIVRAELQKRGLLATEAAGPQTTRRGESCEPL